MTDRHVSNLFHGLAGAKPCPAPLVKDLTDSELAALHAFKHEVAAAGFRLYQHISAAKADGVVRHFVKSLLEEH
jgi:hypothetical protein